MRGSGALFFVVGLLPVLACVSTARAEVEWPDLSTSLPGQGRGEADAAVIVAIEDYAVVEGVPGARKNGDDWYRWLTQTHEVPVGQVVLLRDEEGTNDEIMDAADRAADRVAPGGTLWFVFVGHGAPSADGQDGLLVGWDAQQKATSIQSRSVKQSELVEVLERSNARRVVMLLDACFSGRSGTGEELVPGLQPLVPSYSVPEEGITILSAARTDQYAGPLPGGSRPAFSYLILGALRGWGDLDGDRWVTLAEAVDYARDVLFSLNVKQSPGISGPDGDVRIVRAREKGPDVASLILSLGNDGNLGDGDADRRPADPRSGNDPSDDSTSLVGGPRSELHEHLRQAQNRRDSSDAQLKQARADWRTIWRTRGRADHAKLLSMYLDTYGRNDSEAEDGHRVEVPHVETARAMLRHTRTRSPSFSVASQHWIGIGQCHGISGYSLDVLLSLALYPVQERGSRGSDLTVFATAGAGFVPTKTSSINMLGCDGLHMWTDFSPGQQEGMNIPIDNLGGFGSTAVSSRVWGNVLLGTGQLIDAYSISGTRLGIFASEGIVFDLAEVRDDYRCLDQEDDFPSPTCLEWDYDQQTTLLLDVELSLMFSAHFRSGLLLQVGPRFLIPLMPSRSNFMGGLNVRLGYLEFRP